LCLSLEYLGGSFYLLICQYLVVLVIKILKYILISGKTNAHFFLFFFSGSILKKSYWKEIGLWSHHKVRAHKGGMRISKTPKKLDSICCPQHKETKADTLKWQRPIEGDQELEKRLVQEELTYKVTHMYRTAMGVNSLYSYPYLN
jgi:hypothetical protein